MTMFEVGQYVKIEAPGEHCGLYGWVKGTWEYEDEWLVAVSGRVDLWGPFLWFKATELWHGEFADIRVPEWIRNGKLHRPYQYRKRKGLPKRRVRP